MNWELLLFGIAAAVALAGEVAKRISGRTAQQELLDNYDLVARMKDGEAKDSAQNHLDRRALDLARGRGERDATGAVLGLVILGGGVAAAYYAQSLNGLIIWLLWPAAVLLILMGGYGLVESLGKVDRDEKGRRLPKMQLKITQAPDERTGD